MTTNQDPYEVPFDTSTPGESPAMSGFDLFCAAIAFVLGVVFVLLGIVGLFTGCKANFTLPPILGAIPALVGWGIIKSVRVAWRIRRKEELA